MRPPAARRAVAGLALTLATGAGASEFGFSLGTGLSYRQVEEHDARDRRLLTETGFAPAVSAGLGLTAGPAWIDGGVELSRHVLDYQGRSQLGRALETRSDYRGGRWWLGARLPVGEAWSIGIRWERSDVRRAIRATASAAGLDERYRSDWASLGLRRHVAGRSIDWVEAELVHSLGGTVRVASPGLIDPVSLPQGTRQGLRLQARIPLAPGPGRVDLALEPALSYLQSRASAVRVWTSEGVPQGRIGQPRQIEWQLGAGLRLSW